MSADAARTSACATFNNRAVSKGAAVRFILIYFSFLTIAAAQEAADTKGYLMEQASGTSMNPLSWPMPMVMLRPDDWSLMFMGQAFIVDTQESGPRGAAKFYSPSYGMFAASHDAGGGTFMFQMMLSLDTAAITE